MPSNIPTQLLNILADLEQNPPVSTVPLAARFELEYKRLKALSHKQQHALRRHWRRSLAAIAMALALGVGMVTAKSAQAATITVGGGCTLQNAITSANTDLPTGGCTAGYGADTITLSGGAYTYSTAYGTNSALPDITSEITIEGSGATIARDGAAPDFRILNVSASGDLTLNDVTVSNGYVSGTDGGGIYSQGDLTINDSTISDNGTDLSGGGITIKSGTAELNNSTISGNSANNGGGAIYVTGGVATLNSSTIKDDPYRYAIYVDGGTVTFNACTVSGNAGRVSYINGGLTTFNNCTISGNGKGLYFGAGIGTGVINNSTITGNGGIGLDVYEGHVTLNRTIISGNNNLEVKQAYGSGTVTADNYNVIGYGGSARSTGLTLGASDIVPSGAVSTLLDSTLADNGGATLTNALVSGSPAIDAAPSGACVMSPINQLDQRGYARLTDGDAAVSTVECDIGAVEYSSAPAAFPAEEARLNGVDCALADAIEAANTDTAVGACAAGSGDDTITLLKNSVVSGSALPINSTIGIEGSGYLVTGGYSTQIFDVEVSGDLTLDNAALMGGYSATGGGILSNDGIVAINGSTLTRGSTSSNGGAISNAGSLTLDDSSLEDSSAAENGGGIYNQGTLTIQGGSIISGNGVADVKAGGGIYNKGDVTINDSTISDNTAFNSKAGGLYTRSGTAELNNSTISGNTGDEGDAIFVYSGVATLNNSFISGNGEYALYVDGGEATLNDCTVSGNSGRVSYLVGGVTTFNNCTISDNGKGLYFGGGVGTGVINSSTITGNGGIGLDVYEGHVTLNNTIISGNNNLEVKQVYGSGTVTGANYNVIGYGGSARSNGFTPSGSDLIPSGALDTVLDSTLSGNGGTTLNHALVSGSPAIDAGSCTASGATADQRGYARPFDDPGSSNVDDGCDIGAYEWTDSDGDGVPDEADLCIGDDASGDSDSDGVCDDADICTGDDASGDSDSDGVCDDTDICPGFDDTIDSDGDTVPDGCDLCVGDDATGDDDSDGVCDDTDICPGFDDAIDSDGDSVPDGCDLCTGDDASGDGDGDGICADLDCDDADPQNICEIFSDGFESGDVTAWSVAAK